MGLNLTVAKNQFQAPSSSTLAFFSTRISWASSTSAFVTDTGSQEIAEISERSPHQPLKQIILYPY